MTDESTHNLIIGVVFALIGIIFRSTWNEINQLKIKTGDLQVSSQRLEILISSTYLTRSEFSQLHNDLVTRLEKLSDKIENKIDKLDVAYSRLHTLTLPGDKSL